MKLIPLTCRNCAAPLQVPGDLKHVTCMHCGTQLAVVNEGGAAYTERLDALSQRTDHIEDKLQQLQREQKLAALDRQWDEEEESFRIRWKDGSARLPSKTDGVVMGFAGSLMGIFLIALGPGMTRGSDRINVFFVGFGLLVLGSGIGAAFWLFHRANAYERAYMRYEQRRREILRG